jgi:hypothetical protein
MSGWKKNDLEPPLIGTVLDGNVGVDLTDATSVVVNIRRFDGTIVSRDATPGDQVNEPGSWSMAWVDGDTSVVGACVTEVDVEQPSGRHRTFGTATFSITEGVV